MWLRLCGADGCSCSGSRAARRRGLGDLLQWLGRNRLCRDCRVPTCGRHLRALPRRLGRSWLYGCRWRGLLLLACLGGHPMARQRAGTATIHAVGMATRADTICICHDWVCVWCHGAGWSWVGSLTNACGACWIVMELEVGVWIVVAE